MSYFEQATCDIHCPSNEKTKYMINAESIATMRPGGEQSKTSRARWSIRTTWW